MENYKSSFKMILRGHISLAQCFILTIKNHPMQTAICILLVMNVFLLGKFAQSRARYESLKYENYKLQERLDSALNKGVQPYHTSAPIKPTDIM